MSLLCLCLPFRSLLICERWNTDWVTPMNRALFVSPWENDAFLLAASLAPSTVSACERNKGVIFKSLHQCLVSVCCSAHVYSSNLDPTLQLEKKVGGSSVWNECPLVQSKASLLSLASYFFPHARNTFQIDFSALTLTESWVVFVIKKHGPSNGAPPSHMVEAFITNHQCNFEYCLDGLNGNQITYLTPVKRTKK